MVKLSKLYTRQGDQGDTGLVGGARVKKTSLRVKAYGDVDELNSWMGVIRAQLKDTPSFDEPINEAQQSLFDIGAELATPENSEWTPPSLVSSDDVMMLEKSIDDWTGKVDELKSFLLPGGSELTSYIHVTRAVCRRTERSVLEMAEAESVRDEVIMYLNRLSDWLFALARVVAKETGEAEILWDTARKD